jgi:hypothetical protein
MKLVNEASRTIFTLAGSSKLALKDKGLSSVQRSSQARQCSKLIRLYLQLGLGLRDALPAAEADLRQFAYQD